VSFSIEARIEQRATGRLNDDGEEEAPLDIQQLYLGSQERDIFLMPAATKYFYFQNWRGEELRFTL